MKIKMTIILIAISAILTSGYPGEYRFYIKDASSDDYYIKVVRFDNNEPIFGINLMMIEGDDYDEVTSDEVDYADESIPAGFHYYLGFDLLRDQGNYRWPFIADGKYEFQIYREDVLVLKFRMDLRQNASSPDIDFEYTYPNNYIIAKDEVTLTIYNNQEINSWTLYNEDRDWSIYYNEVELKNSINSSGTFLKLEAADNGFPETSYSVGTEFSTGTVVELWRGAYYEFSVKNTEVTSGGNTYKFRNWFNTDNYETSNLFKVESNQTKFESVFNQTQSLTITNYLEGGSGGTYTLTWSITDETTAPINSGVSYHAFDGTELTDRYSIDVNSSIPSMYGQTWTFFEWSDGVTSTTRSNEQITSSNNNFTAYYKSKNRTDNNSTYSSNGQTRIVQTSDGLLHKVYESMGKVWYEKYDENVGYWQIMNNGEPLNSNDAKNPAIAVLQATGATSFVIAYQTDDHFKIMLEYFTSNNSYQTSVYSSTIFQDISSDFSFDSYVTLAYSQNLNVLAAFKIPDTGSGSSLYYWY